MDLGFLMDITDQFGYVALFFTFYVCLLGLPVPNEVLIMTGGLISSTSDLHPVISFFIIYCAVILNATILFFLGRTGGQRLLHKLERFQKFQGKITKASSIVRRYGPYASALCYLLPVMRHCIPFLMGSYRFPYATFARFSYPSAFLWSLALYLIGSFFGSKVETIGQHVYTVGISILCILVILLFLTLLKRYFSKENGTIFSK